MRKLLILLLLGAGILRSQSTTLVIQPSGSGASDNAVASNAPSVVYSSQTFLPASSNGSSDVSRFLLKMDLSSIPANAIVSSANLYLYGEAHFGTNPCYLRKNIQSWNPTTVNWAGAPANTTAGQIALAQSTSGTQNYVLNVTTFVQEMINLPATNYGWTMQLQNESNSGQLAFCSGNHTNPSLRPRLVLTYSLPMTVRAYMTPSSGSFNADGGLNVFVENGEPPYSYSWSDGSTTEDIDSKLPGLYTLTVTDNIGNQVKKHLMIGAANVPTTFVITPDALSGKDAQIKANYNGALNNGSYSNAVQVVSQYAGGPINWVKTRSLLSFDLSSLPSNAVVNSALLNLYGDGHNPSGRTNTSYLHQNNVPWQEETVTWNTQPSHYTSNSITIPGTSTSNQNVSVNVLSHVQYWVNSPNENFGWKIALTDEANYGATLMSFGSSDHATSGLKPSLVISVTIPVLSDNDRNWVMEESYDENGNVITTQKTYLDELGRPTQSLSKDGYGNVLSSQTAYDSYGRAAVKSLPAYTGSSLTYKTDLFLNNNWEEYNYLDFDGYATNNPRSLFAGFPNTVSSYYSDTNPYDLWQATTPTPYIRTQYVADPSNEIKTVNGPDVNFNAASGRQSRSYNMMCGDELKYIFGAANSYKVQTNPGDPLSNTPLTIPAGYFLRATKNITVSPDNKEVISYYIGDKQIASCVSGLHSPDNCNMTSVRSYMDWYGTQTTDIHIPDAGKSSIIFPLPTYKFGPNTFTVQASDIYYTITDQSTEELLSDISDFSFNTVTRALTFSPAFLSAHSGQALFLRIQCHYSSTFESGMFAIGITIPAGIVQYNLDYGHWSVNYYDLAGKLRKSVSAKGIDCSSPGTITMATTYDYSHLGELISEKSPDEGITEYAYDIHGQLRFSKNSEQKDHERFSYVNYDKHGRTIESGEFVNTSGSDVNGLYFQNYYNDYSAPFVNNVPTSSIIDLTDGIDDHYCDDVRHVSYEKLNVADDIPLSYPHVAYYDDHYKNGQVSKTWSSVSSTWYKYDEAGRQIANLKMITDPDFENQAGRADKQIRTMDFTYDPYFGLVMHSYFQKHELNEYAEHAYTYDVNKRLSAVNLITGSNAAVQVASYEYDLLGRVKRKVIGPGLQGVDYVFTINDKLKAINHPSLERSKDRGNDSESYNDLTNGTAMDLFGEILEYYPGDYTRTNTSIELNNNGFYNGLIHGIRYKTRNEVNGTNTGADYIDYMGANQVQLTNLYAYDQEELANRYEYNAFGQLTQSTFGTFDNNTKIFTGRTDYLESGINGTIEYDANGNIRHLLRNSYDVSSTPQQLDHLTYTYMPNTNMHTYVEDQAVNGFPSSFNYMNQSYGSPAPFQYNRIGQMVASADENISQIIYYSKGQVKLIAFNNGNVTEYAYDDEGQKYKTVNYDANTGQKKFRWIVQGTVYEYVEGLGSFDLKELSLAGQGRIGVYKQDVSGIDITNGHSEYELTDHLGNVRVTFRQGSRGYDLDVLSKADYYAFGGTLPGRIWQQSAGDYRFGYQGQEKSTQPDVNWDEFELRMYNHDLGRWSAPDPYGQFHSPYIGMGNNPVSMTDPDGGYINMSAEGQAQRKQFLDQLAFDRFMQRGRFSYEWLYPQYKDAVERLRSEYLRYNNLENGGGAEGTGIQFLEALLKLNNEYMGLGLGSDFLSSGTDYVTRSTIQTDYGSSLYKKLQDMNGTSAMMEDKANSLSKKYFDPFEAGTQAWIDANDARQRDYVKKWREEKWESMDAQEASERTEKAGQLNPGDENTGMPLAAATPTDPPGGKGKQNMIRDNIMRRVARPHDKGFGKRFKLSDIHFAVGFRLGNTVYLDLRVNSQGNSTWEKNFPGRFWLPWNNDHASFRFSLIPYRVFRGPDPQSYYRNVWRSMHLFIGGYEAFFECDDYPFRTHKK